MAALQKNTAEVKRDYHVPVLIDEAIDFLAPGPGKKIIDATIGGGGHTKALLKSGAKVLALDRDQDAIDYINKNFEGGIKSKNLIIVKGNFNNMQQIAASNNFENVSGILLDLGLSSHQLNEAKRGFSFQKAGPLDMRMDQDLGVKAQDIINNFNERRLDEILRTYGEEKLSRAIAFAICRAREVKKITTTQELAQLIQEVYGKNYKSKVNNRNRNSKLGTRRINFATKTFQALRIIVNSEILNLEECLPQAISILEKGGRLVVISYHSLEERVVKRFLKSQKKLKLLTKKPVGPQEFEVRENPRARSAKLRAAERI